MEDKLPEGLYRPKYKDLKTGEVKESAIIWCRYFRNGKKERVCTKTADVRQAKKFRARCVGGKRPVTTELQRTNFDDLAKLVIADYEAKGLRSKKRIEEALAHLRGFFECDRARDIGTVRINEYIKYRQNEGAGNGTINRELSALHKGFNLAAKADPPQVDHVPAIPKLKEPDPPKGFFKREDLDAVLKHLPEYLRAPIYTLYVTGWRGPSEILSRKRSDLSPQWVLRLDPGEGKTGAAREFPVWQVPELREVLERQLETTHALEKKTGKIIPWLFHNENGKRIRKDTRTYYGPWHAACRAAGLENADRKPIPHDFRRTAARNLNLAAVPETVAMRITGHKTASVFRRYAIMDTEVTDWGVGKLAELLEAEKGHTSNVVPLQKAADGAK